MENKVKRLGRPEDTPTGVLNSLKPTMPENKQKK